jgi:hypothetical protein
MKRLYQQFFNALPIRYSDPDEKLDILTADELYLVQETEKSAMWASVFIELAAYLLSYLPVYAFPDFFLARSVTIGGPFFGALEPLPWVRALWSVGVNLGEIYVLLLLNLAAVHGIAVATGFIRRGRREAHTRGLIRIAMGRRFGGQEALGIDPFQGMNHWLLYGYLLVNRLKGFLGNIVIRSSLASFFGQEIRRYLLDFSGMPLYMAINVYSTRVILRNARVAIMGQSAVAAVVRRLPDLHLDGFGRELLYDALQYIAVNKRNYHVNHFLLTRGVLERYGIPPERQHPLPADFIDRLLIAPPDVAAVCRQLIVLGFILDGRISRQEFRHLGTLRTRGVLAVGDAELEAYCRDFVEGRGLSGVLEKLAAGAAASGS